MAEKLKIISLGGLNEIGKNMTVYEYGNDMIVVDAGMGFPDDDMYGIDVVIPDFSYLIKNRERIMEYFCDPAAAVRCKFQRFKTKMLFVCFLDRNQGPGNQNGKKREEVAKDGFCLAGKMLLEEKEDYSSREEGKDTVKVCFAGVFCVGACCDRRKGGDRGDFPCESAGILSGRVGFSV